MLRENILVFIINAFLFDLSSPSVFIAINLFWIFTITGILHTIVHSVINLQPQQPVRAILFLKILCNQSLHESQFYYIYNTSNAWFCCCVSHLRFIIFFHFLHLTQLSFLFWSVWLWASKITKKWLTFWAQKIPYSELMHFGRQSLCWKFWLWQLSHQRHVEKRRYGLPWNYFTIITKLFIFRLLSIPKTKFSLRKMTVRWKQLEMIQMWSELEGEYVQIFLNNLINFFNIRAHLNDLENCLPFLVCARYAFIINFYHDIFLLP